VQSACFINKLVRLRCVWNHHGGGCVARAVVPAQLEQLLDALLKCCFAPGPLLFGSLFVGHDIDAIA